MGVSQPPCEAVSWNFTSYRLKKCRPASASLWGCELKWWQSVYSDMLPGQPPCEAVSWNIWFWLCCCSSTVSLLVRLWVEMKSRFRAVCTAMVSLLVRLWVEIASPWLLSLLWTSASLWGCELKCLIQDASLSVSRQPPCEAVSWNASRGRLKYPTFVSLLVRLWVEMLMYLLSFSHTLMSASLWGCELKCSQWVLCCSCAYCQPPCEAVSWNIPADEVLKDAGGQPPCEAVSWNSDFPSIRLVARSASLWGCELKFLCRLAILAPVPVSLLECWNAFLVMP